MHSDISNQAEIGDARRRFKRWMRSRDDEQRGWVKDYLADSEYALSFYRESKTDAPSGSFWQHLAAFSYDQLITFLAEMYVYSREGVIEINKLKSAWSQKKYRDKLKQRDKKAYNFVLGKETGKKLAKVAKVTGVSMNQAIEQMVEIQHSYLVDEGFIRPPSPPTPYGEFAVPARTDWRLFDGVRETTLRPVRAPLAESYRIRNEWEEEKRRKSEALRDQIKNLSLRKGSAVASRAEKKERLKQRLNQS